MASKNRLPVPEHFQSVVEWRYARAHRYWDDCGKLVAAIEAEFPGLACEGLESQGFKFAGKSRGVSGAGFYWDKASIGQVALGDASIPDAAARFWPIVQAGLSILCPTRIGHRTWLLFPTDTPKEALCWLQGLAVWRFSSPEVSRLGSPQTTGAVLRTRLEPGGRSMRVEFNAGTLSAGGRDRHGVIIDVDVVVEAPSALPDDFADFVSWNLTFLRENVVPVFRTR